MSDLESALRRHFGHGAFRDGQRAVVGALLRGESALAVLPTGGGKSLCYQLPAVLRDGVALVISPLLALMKDQVDALVARGIAAGRLDSTLGPGEAARVLRDARSGGLKLLYVAPERFANEGFLAWLGGVRVSLVALDEAHCISEWGHNFRPDYLRLSKLIADRRLGPVLALTATATGEVADDIRRSFGISEGNSVRTSFLRDNLVFSKCPTASGGRDARLLGMLRRHPDVPSIVYVTLQRTAERLAAVAQRAGLKAKAYHAGLGDGVRAMVQDDFLAGRLPIVIATVAFGMGIDKPDIRRVIHYNLPGSVEAYSQETGRAGRDGARAWCVLIAGDEDRLVLENFAHGDMPEDGALRQLVRQVLGQAGEREFSHYDLALTHDIRQLVVSTVLTYLELDGHLTATGPRHAGYKFRLLEPESSLLAGYDARRRRFLVDLFRAASKGRKWWTLDMDAALAATGGDRRRVVAALGHLSEGGSIECAPAGLRHGYRIHPAGGSISEVVRRIEEYFRTRLDRDLGRIGRVVDLLHAEDCVPRRICRYFGEKVLPCGQCDVCLGEGEPSGGTWSPPELGADDVALMRAIRDERHAALKSARQFSRFLCGITSPASIRARLTRDPRFGCLGHVPFPTVLAQAREMPG